MRRHAWLIQQGGSAKQSVDVDVDVELLASAPCCDVNTAVSTLHIFVYSHSKFYELVWNLLCEQNIDLGVRTHVYVHVCAEMWLCGNSLVGNGPLVTQLLDA